MDKVSLNLKENINTRPKGLRTYKIKGVDHMIVAKKGGPSADQIKSADSYREVREHQKEFGVASMMSKALRSSLSQGMSEICETYVSGRLTAEFRNLAKLEEGITGKRPFCPSKHGHRLSGFEFNTKSPYNQIFGAKYYVRQGSTKGQVILHFPAFVPTDVFVIPDEATNFKITARLVALSDFEFDKVSETYRPKNQEIHGKYGSFECPMLPVLKIPTEPMTGQVSLPFNVDCGEEMGLFLVMAVSFFRYENGIFRHLAKDSAMQIHQVY